MDPLVSVIIPTYNVEQYLLKCLESVENQSYSNFECIIVIDGATDNSFEIARDYCSSHPRFSVYYQNNAGSGPARNNGVKRASGEFLCFIDPDDWVEPNYIESLVSEQRKGDYDLVISLHVVVNIGEEDSILSTKKQLTEAVSLITQENCRKIFPEVMFANHLLDGPICKLFRTSIIKDNDVEFPPYRRSQDMVFNIRYYNYISSLRVIPEHTYNIRNEYPPRPNRGRIFVEYHIIVSKIFEELVLQLESWGEHGYTEPLCTWSFSYICACLYRYVPKDISIDFLREEPFKTIVNCSNPKLSAHKIIKLLISLRAFRLLIWIIKYKEKIRYLHD